MEESRKVGVLLVDDHDVVRAGIRALIERHEDFRVVAEVSNGTAAIEFCKENHPDLAVVDISMPGLGGIDTIRDITRRSPKLRVLVLSMMADDRSVLHSFRAGARGFVVKSAHPGDLMEALRTVSRGGIWLSPDASGHLMLRIQRGQLDESGPGPAAPNLSNREAQVVQLIGRGLSTKEVAQRLALSHETARSYRKAAMKKLGVSNAAELTVKAYKLGLLDWSDDGDQPKDDD